MLCYVIWITRFHKYLWTLVSSPMCRNLPRSPCGNDHCHLGLEGISYQCPTFLKTKATKCANPPHTGDAEGCQYGGKAPLKHPVSWGGGGRGLLLLLHYYRFQYSHRNQSAWKKVESRKIVELSKRLSIRATTSVQQIMQTLSTFPVSIVILATRTT